MKIGSDKPDALAGGVDAPGAVTASARQAPKPADLPNADQVTLSPAARMLGAAAAAEAIDSAPAIRADVVQQMQTLMADGGLDGDAGTLADAILDYWLGVR